MNASGATTTDRLSGGDDAQLVPAHDAADSSATIISRGPGAAVDDVPAVSALIGDIYDASLDPTLWPAVLAKVREFINGSAAAIFSKDASIKSLNVYYDCGNSDPRYRQLYSDTYAKLDPFTTAHVLAEIEQPICTSDVMPYEEFLETRFYREWAEPQGLVDFVTAALEKSATGAALFGVFRQQRHGLVDAHCNLTPTELRVLLAIVQVAASRRRPTRWASARQR